MTEISPFEVKTVDQYTSDELVAFVARRQEARLQVLPHIASSRKYAGEIKVEIISQRLAQATDKLQKEYERHMRSEEKLTKALSAVIALKTQLGLE